MGSLKNPILLKTSKVTVSARKRISKLRFAAYGLMSAFVAAVAISSTAQAIGEHCGEFTYQGQYAAQAVPFNSTTQRCEIVLESYAQNGADVYNNFKLPSWVTSLNATLVGGGGSGAADVGSGQGGGGGGGGAIVRTSFNIPGGVALTVGVGGTAMPEYWNSPGYTGQDGFSTYISYTSGTNYSVVAGGGKAPTSNQVTAGGAGGVASGNISRDQTNSYNGKAYGDTQPVYGLVLSGFANRLGSGGGSATGAEDPGWRLPGYGAGGGGIDIRDNGGYFTALCNADWSAPISGDACFGAAGVIRIQYEALNYVPVSWDQTPLINDEVAVGTTISMTDNYYFSGAQNAGSTTATETYNWYRCSGTASSGLVQAASCTTISGAVSSTYTPVLADLGFKIQGRMTLSNSGQFTSGTAHTTTIRGFTNTSVVIDTPGAPSLTGYVLQSPTRVKLTISPGTNWGELRTYGIKDFGSGFTKTGTLSGSELSFTGMTPGTTYTVKVSQQNAAGTAYSTNTVTFTMPPLVTVTQQGSLTGDFRVNSPLTYTPSTFVGGGSINRTTTWYHCTAASVLTPYSATSYETTVGTWTNGCTLFSNQPTTSTVVPTAIMGTKRLVLIETATDGFTTTYNRIVSDPIARAPGVPTALTVSSNAAGQVTITFAKPAAEGETAVSSYGYSYASGPNFLSFNSTVYVSSGVTVSNGIVTFNVSGLPTANALKFRVVVGNGGGISGFSSESGTVTLQAAAAMSGAVTISGTAAVGSTLSVNTSSLTLTGNPAPTLLHSWWACDSSTVASASSMSGCTQISGATSASYQVDVSASQKYVVYRATATNTTGGPIQNFAHIKSVATIQVPGVPGGVTSLTVSALAQTSVTVGYALPSQVGAGPVNGIEYRIAAAPGYSFPLTWTAAPNFSGTFGLADLLANTTYKIQVRAGNIIGFGTGVESGAFTTLGAPTVSQSPTVSGTLYVGRVLTAQEPAGMFNGNPTPAIASRSWYRCPTPVSASASLAGCSAIAGTNSTSYTISSADTSRYLVFSATATNSVGSVVASSPSTLIVANVPAAPAVTSAALAGQGAINLSVELGAANNAAITDIEYEINSSGTWVSTSGTNTTFLISGLTNGQESSVRVRTVNAVGNSAASIAVLVTPLATPSAPSAVRGDGSIQVSWSALAGAVGYSVQISTNANSGFATATGNCSGLSGTSCVISGLTNGQDYYLKLVANNDFGNSSASLASSAIRPLSRLTTLSSLQIKTRSGSSSNQVVTTFTNNFESNLRSYSINVNSAVQFVTLTPTAGVQGQLIKVNGSTVNSGSVSSNVALSFGANTISIEVQSAEHVADSSSTATASYTVSVVRAEPSLAAFTALSNETASSSPVPSTFASVGVAGVTISNVAAINSAIAGLPSTAVDTVAELQAVVDAYVSILAQAGGASPAQPPTAADFAAIGATAASNFNANQIGLLNSLIRSQNRDEVSSVDQIKLMASAVANIYQVAAGGSTSSLTVEQLTAIGVQGVTQANLPLILVALAASPDDGSGTDTLAEIQALVNFMKATAVTAIAASSNSQTLPTVQAYLQAGITGISTASAPAIGGFLAGLGNNAKDSTAEIQAVVDSFKFLLSSARGGSAAESNALAELLGINNPTAGPTADTYAALGITAASTLDSSALALLNSTLGNLDAAQLDSPAELTALATAVATVINSTSNATLQDFQKLGLTGVTSANLATIKTLIASANSSAKDSFTELQTLIDNSLIATATTAFANASTSATAMPTVQDFRSMGVAGVTNGNIASISAAIRAAAAAASPQGSWTATPLAIQNLVDNLSAGQVVILSSYSGTGSAPVAADYRSIGIVGLKQDQLAIINQLVASLPSSATDTAPEIQSVVDAYAAVTLAATSGKGSVITLEHLQSLGLSGVSSANFTAVANAISAAGSTNIDTLQELESLVASAIAAVSSSVAVITSFISSPTASPSLNSFKAAGLVGVTAANKSQIETALLEANPAPSTPQEIQAVINSAIAASIQILANASDRPGQIRIADFAQAGIEGVSSANLTAILRVMATKDATQIDSPAEVQKLVDSLTLVTAAAFAGSNASPSAPKPTPVDFQNLGLDLGLIAGDREAFAFLIATLAKLPQSVAASPVELQSRIDVVNDILRVASRKEPLAPLNAAALNQIGLVGVTETNVANVLAEIATGTAGIAGLPALENVAVRYSSVLTNSPSNPNTAGSDETTTTPVPTVRPTPQPTVSPTTPTESTSPVVTLPVLPKPAVLSFGAGSTTLTPAAKAVVASQVVKFVKAKAKTVVVTVTVTLPKNSSSTWTKQVMDTANKRGAAVTAVIKSELKKLKSSAKTVVRIVTTPEESVRTVSVAARR